MFTGHLGITAALRSTVRREDSTYALIAVVCAGYMPDVVDLVLSFAGVCSPYGLYTHTFPSVAVQMTVAAGAIWLASHSKKLAILALLAVLLHPLADWFTGSKLYMPGGEMHGLVLYKNLPVDFVLEASAVLAGWWLMKRSRQGPGWATSVYVLITVILVQLSFDVVSATTQANIKPNACFHETNSHA